MDPVHEHSLRRWVEYVLAREGQSLRKTPPYDPNFTQYGRWSRWFYDKWAKRQVLMEHHVDLADLVSRCHGYLNARKYNN